MRELFQGYVVKVWSGVNFNQNKYNALNKILAKHCILYYMKCWYVKNDYYRYEKLQKKRVLTWKKEIEKQAKANKSINFRALIRRMKLDKEQSNSNTIHKWIYSINNMKKKAKELPRNNIR